MTWQEKAAVESHLLKASRLGEKSVGYRMIRDLFSRGELSLMFSDRETVLDIRKGCKTLGLTCEMRWDKIFLEDLAIVDYYKNIMGLQPTPLEEEKSYYQRMMEAKTIKSEESDSYSDPGIV